MTMTAAQKKERAQAIKAFKDISEGKVQGVKIHRTKVIKYGNISMIID